jgi:MFS family permease
MTFSSLRVRNYRLFFIGQIISTSGTWMQSVAQMWLVLHLTSSGFALGVTAALQFLPMLLLGTWGGLMADRVDKRRMLVATQLLASGVALSLAIVTLTGIVQLWTVFLLAGLMGVVNAIDTPTRQSFVTEMVGPVHVSNAVSLNAAIFTSARVIGPAIAGILIALVGTGWCFLFNGFSYLAVVAALLLMRPTELYRQRPVARTRGQIRAGIGYAWNRHELRLPLFVMLVVGGFGFHFTVLLPLMAKFTFHLGADAFGLLLSLMGVGSLIGALVAASRQRPTLRLLTLAAFAFGILMLGAAWMPNLALEMVVLVPLGLALTTLQATSNALLQLNSDAEFRGRVMSLYTIVFIGTTPIGSPLIGWVAQQFGPRVGLALGGVAALVAAFVATFALRRWHRAHPAALAEPA